MKAVKVLIFAKFLPLVISILIELWSADSDLPLALNFDTLAMKTLEV